MIPEGQGPEAPAGADRLTVRVRRVAVEGGLPALAGTTAALQARLSGRTVTAAEIFAAARELEQAYAAQGYALVRVVLPAQQLRDGADVRLTVVDGVIERVDVSALPAEIRDRVAAMLGPVVGERGLRLSLLERKLLLAGDTPGTVLRSTLAPGTAPGASVLVVEARYKAVTGFTGVDNTLAQALGTYTASFGLDMNSPSGHGETLYLRSFGLPLTGGSAAFLGPEPRNRALAAGLILPLGFDGMTLTLEATDARTAARAAAGTIGFGSDFSRYSARLRYPLIRSRDFTLNAEAAFDAQEERVDIRVPVATPFSLDRLRIARGATDVLWFLPTEGVLSGRLTSSFGIDGLGAREPPLAGSDRVPLSRQGARPEFQKLDASLTLTQPLAEHLTLAVLARGQTSFNQALPRSEQIGLATLTGLSTFDAGLFQGDEGFVTRGELQFPFVVPLTLPFGLPAVPAQQGTGLPPADETPGAFAVSPYGFGAFGLVRQQNPTALERAMMRGAAYGAGLRIAAAPASSFSNAAVTVEYGRAERSDRLPADNRLTFTVALQF
ncbi:ShlB/FhaC/HecB family hemolysin secretion/activation protein [uncultured Methylobacterium sp.]|uniref:ShlB/FhaC/HecB family hemolysin secretion/activation protein n=1 Tax=uncultured Methylobacterium sp. TaxID=157278 RepID=UPI0035C94590